MLKVLEEKRLEYWECYGFGKGMNQSPISSKFPFGEGIRYVESNGCHTNNKTFIQEKIYN